ncbi:MAG: hypothetical protein ABI699_01415 [Caldimonas sp.]
MKKSTARVNAGGVKARTLRLEPIYEVGLGILKGVLHKPVNKMVNEAVAEYIKKSTAQVEAEMGSVLTQLKAYRRADPTFQQDKEAFISAEAEFGASDPMEGVTFKVARHRRPMKVKASASKEKAGAALTMVREMLRS